MKKTTDIKEKSPSKYKDKSCDEIWEIINYTEDHEKKIIQLTRRFQKGTPDKKCKNPMDAENMELKNTLESIAKYHGTGGSPINQELKNQAYDIKNSLTNMDLYLDYFIWHAIGPDGLARAIKVCDDIIELTETKVEGWKIELANQVRKNFCEWHGIKYSSTPDGYAVSLILLICNILDIKLSKESASHLVRKFKNANTPEMI